MKKKKEDFYYKNLGACIELSYKAGMLLRETLEKFDKNNIEEKISQMHEIEQKADSKKHKMMSTVSQAFITPIEREDLVALSSYLDDITDAIEDILLQIYMSNVAVIRVDVIEMLDLLLEEIQALGDVIKELKDFKHSKVIDEYIIRVNDIEEQADYLYMKNMYHLHQEKELLTVVVWRTIYEHIENCIDTCEHAADIIKTIILKNS